MRTSRIAAYGIAAALLFQAPAVFARPPLVLDYVSGIGDTPTTRTMGNADTHSNFVLKWTPLADTALCELDVRLKTQGTVTGGSVAIAVLASPSNSFYYSWQADTTLDYTLIGTSFAFKTFTFYNADNVGFTPAGAGSITGLTGDLTAGTCPVMYGGHQYWIYVEPRSLTGSSSPRIVYEYWSPKDISKYTSHAWYRNDLGQVVQELTSEIEARGYGYGAFAGLPGTVTYENAIASQWVTSASYNFASADYGRLGNFFRDAIVGLFFPSQGIFGQFASLSDAVKNKPPMGYITAVRTTFGTLATSSENVDTTQAHAAIRSLTDPLRTGISWLLYVLFAAYLFRRFSHIEL